MFGGGHLLLAYRVLAVAAAFALLWVTRRFLLRLGLPSTHLLPALVLVATGAGLGGALHFLAGRDLRSCLDLYAGLFPYLGLLTNPHFTVGTSLLLLGLLLFDEAATAREQVAAHLAATALALVRPYDFVLLVLIRGLVVLLSEKPREYIRALVPLVALLPVTGYLYWLFYRNPAFAFYTQADYVFPPLSQFAWALGPAVLLALPGGLRPAADASAQRARLYLLVWAAFGVIVPLLQPVHFSLQFLVGIGLPLLALGALGLARWRPAVTLGVALLFSTSQLAALWIVLQPNPYWLAPQRDLQVVRALRAVCRPGDVLFAPPGVGLFAFGLTACRSFVSHPVAPDHARRIALLEHFSRMSTAERRALLDTYGVAHLVLPGDAGEAAEGWLGAASGFARVSGSQEPGGFSIYTRGGLR
jgi:hypothetical protein